MAVIDLHRPSPRSLTLNQGYWELTLIQYQPLERDLFAPEIVLVTGEADIDAHLQELLESEEHLGAARQIMQIRQEGYLSYLLEEEGWVLDRHYQPLAHPHSTTFASSPEAPTTQPSSELRSLEDRLARLEQSIETLLGALPMAQGNGS